MHSSSGRPRRARRRGVADPWLAELRADARPAALLAAGIALSGLPAAALWWALVPRATFRVTDQGPEVIGQPPVELLIARDAVYTLVLAGVGLLAALVTWRLRTRRGVGALLGLTAGTGVAALLAWQVGEAIGAGPSEAELATVGAQFTSGVALGSPAALAVAPFVAVFTYLAATLLSPDEDLGRPSPPAGASGPPTPVAGDPPGTGRPLADVPPAPRAGGAR